jgi:hypothetical protein
METQPYTTKRSTELRGPAPTKFNPPSTQYTYLDEEWSPEVLDDPIGRSKTVKRIIDRAHSEISTPTTGRGFIPCMSKIVFYGYSLVEKELGTRQRHAHTILAYHRAVKWLCKLSNRLLQTTTGLKTLVHGE